MVEKNGIQNAKIFKVMLSSYIFNKINIGGGNHFLITFFYFCASNYGFCHDWTFFDAFFLSYCYDSSILSNREMP